MKGIEKLIDWLYPKGLTCNGCGKELFDDERKYSLCKRCAKKIFESDGTYLGERLSQLLETEGGHQILVRSCFRYEGLVRNYVIDYKDHNKNYLCDSIALHLTELYQRCNITADLVAFVPTSKTNLRKRGYDGMKWIAESFSNRTGLPLSYDLFRRDGIDQAKVAPENRAQNVKNKFLSRGGFSGTVLLLDDVVTSGATVEACAQTILSHGAEKVLVLTFAVAGEERK